MAAFAFPLNVDVDVSDFSRILGFQLQEALIPSMITIHAMSKRQEIRTSGPTRVIMQDGVFFLSGLLTAQTQLLYATLLTLRVPFFEVE